MYNTYEEYMQNVLGVTYPNTYNMPVNNNYFEPRNDTVNLQEINNLYPEIYGIVYPMVQKVCGRSGIGMCDERQINEMVEEVYNAIESGDTPIEKRDDIALNSKNGDVKNPRAKETRRPNNNFLLRDLIRILIIREILQGGGWHGGMPGRPPRPGPRWSTDGPRRIPRRPWISRRTRWRKTTNNTFTDTWECTKASEELKKIN